MTFRPGNNFPDVATIHAENSRRTSDGISFKSSIRESPMARKFSDELEGTKKSFPPEIISTVLVRVFLRRSEGVTLLLEDVDE